MHSQQPVINMMSVMNLSYKSKESLRQIKPPNFEVMKE